MQIRIFGLFSLGSGYGEMAREFSRAISLAGQDVCNVEMQIPGARTIQFSRKMADFLNEHQEKREPHISVYCTIPAHFPRIINDDLDAQYRIGFTMFEGRGCVNKSYVFGCNLMDEIWIPTEYNVGTFVNSGVTVPAHVVPLGIDCEEWHPGPYNFAKKEYNFFSNFSWEGRYRKGFDKLLAAYFSSFSGRDKVRLVLKTTGGGTYRNDIQRLINLAVRAARLKDPPCIDIYTDFYSTKELLNFYHDADCVVLPTRGEGWCMPALEAMACAIPVIVTGEGSQLAFCNIKNSLLIKNMGYENTPDNEKQLFSEVKWAEPDHYHLASLMKWCYQHPQEARKIGFQGLQTARSFSWINSAKVAIQNLNERDVLEWPAKKLLTH